MCKCLSESILKNELKNNFFSYQIAKASFLSVFSEDKKICKSVVSNIVLAPRNSLTASIISTGTL